MQHWVWCRSISGTSCSKPLLQIKSAVRHTIVADPHVVHQAAQTHVQCSHIQRCLQAITKCILADLVSWLTYCHSAVSCNVPACGCFLAISCIISVKAREDHGPACGCPLEDRQYGGQHSPASTSSPDSPAKQAGSGCISFLLPAHC